MKELLLVKILDIFEFFAS